MSKQTKRDKLPTSGLPIYEERYRRPIADVAVDSLDTTEWQPRTSVTKKLWRCLELLRDIQEVLDFSSQASDRSSQRRRLKSLSAPLVSLAKELKSLCNSLASDPVLSKFISDKKRRAIVGLRESLAKDVPLGKGSELLEIRNKLSAHLDKKMVPKTARRILDKVSLATYGQWVHSCVAVLYRLLELNVYSWQAVDVPKDHIRIMNTEPWVLTIARKAGSGSTLVGLDVGSSPRQVVAEACGLVVKKSQWLFGPQEPRLVVIEEEPNKPNMG